MVYAQRQIKLEEALLDQPPPGFSELRDEIMGFAEGELRPQGAEDLSAMFVIITDGELTELAEPYLTKVSKHSAGTNSEMLREASVLTRDIHLRSLISVEIARLSFRIGTRDSSIVGMLTDPPNPTMSSHTTSEGFRGGWAMDGRMTTRESGCH